MSSHPSAEFGRRPDGTVVGLFTLANAKGMAARIMTHGATLVELHVPDREGKRADVVQGFDTLGEYLDHSPYFGSTIGRFGNRIGGAGFSLDGVTYKIDANERGNTLHGGHRGFDKVIWSVVAADDRFVELSYLSKDGEAGFPGNLATVVRYTLSEANELIIEYSATTDKPTVVNLTHHSYFNLGGHGAGTILDHELMIEADRYTPVDARLIPTGEIAPVAGTPFDFGRPERIGGRIGADHQQLKFGGGYDHNWVLNSGDRSLALAATLYDPASGRVMEVLTSEPGIQFYAGNFLNNVLGKGGAVYRERSGLCLETQHFPDSPNQPHFPSTRLSPGQAYQTTTVHRFSAR